MPAPRTAAVPEPPPDQALQTPPYHFDNLTGTMDDTPRNSEQNTPPHSELGPATDGMHERWGDSHSDDQNKALAPEQAPPPEPSLQDQQPTAQTVSSTAQPATDP